MSKVHLANGMEITVSEEGRAILDIVDTYLELSHLHWRTEQKEEGKDRKRGLCSPANVIGKARETAYRELVRVVKCALGEEEPLVPCCSGSCLPSIEVDVVDAVDPEDMVDTDKSETMDDWMNTTFMGGGAAELLAEDGLGELQAEEEDPVEEEPVEEEVEGTQENVPEASTPTKKTRIIGRYKAVHPFSTLVPEPEPHIGHINVDDYLIEFETEAGDHKFWIVSGDIDTATAPPEGGELFVLDAETKSMILTPHGQDVEAIYTVTSPLTVLVEDTNTTYENGVTIVKAGGLFHTAVVSVPEGRFSIEKANVNITSPGFAITGSGMKSLHKWT